MRVIRKIDLRKIDLTTIDIPNRRRLIGAALLSGCLFGCVGATGNADDALSGFVTEPGKFALFNCQQITDQASAVAARQNQLQALMSKARIWPDGLLVSEIAYRPEQLSLRGDINELRHEAAAKNCKILPKEMAAKRSSDNAIQ